MNNEASLKDSFTEEAWEILFTYFGRLRKALNSKNISNQSQESVLNGIYDYINEFVSEREPNKIDFQETLTLMKDIGSPNDIILAVGVNGLDKEEESIETEYSDLINCQKCGFSNLREAQFCENCGISMPSLSIGKINLNQFLYDHPYFFSLLTVYTSIAILYTILKGSDYGSTNLYTYLTFVPRSLISPEVIFLTIICTFLVGYIADKLFEPHQSDKLKLKKALSSIEDSFVSGLIVIYICLTYFVFSIIYIVSDIGIDGIFAEPALILPFTIIYFLIAISSFFILWYWNSSERMFNPNYLTLLRIKQTSEFKMKKVFLRNLIYGIPGGIVTTIIFIGIIAVGKGWIDIVSIIVGIIAGFMLFSLIIGYSHVYHYSWTILKSTIDENFE